MSIETERFDLRKRAHESNIEHLNKQVELKQKELDYFESMKDPIMSVEPTFSYENEEDFGLLRLESMRAHLAKEVLDVKFEIENNELALRDLVESEDARSNRH